MVATMINDLSNRIQNIHYLVQRLTTIRNRLVDENKAVEGDLGRILADAAYALGTIAVVISKMEAEHEQMKTVLRWIVKGDLEEHIDEVRAFIDA
jgi:hypothetical protein